MSCLNVILDILTLAFFATQLADNCFVVSIDVIVFAFLHQRFDLFFKLCYISDVITAERGRRNNFVLARGFIAGLNT